MEDVRGIKTRTKLACLPRTADERNHSWLKDYREQGILQYALAAILRYHYEDVIHGRAISLDKEEAKSRILWLDSGGTEKVVGPASPVSDWAVETSRLYFSKNYAQEPEYQYKMETEETQMFLDATQWLEENVKLAPLQKYQVVAMPYTSNDPLLHFSARVPSRVLSVVNIDPVTLRPVAPIIVTPSGLSLTSLERLTTIVHETLHISQGHPPQTDSMHSNLIEGITDALSLLATGQQKYFYDTTAYLGDYAAELRFIIVVHLVAQAHRHQPLIQTLRDLHQEFNVEDISPTYVERVLTQYTKARINWDKLYTLTRTARFNVDNLYQQLTGSPSPVLRLV